MYIYSSNNHFLDNKITNSHFNYNKATREGGAIKYTLYKPRIENCTFEMNEAHYGSNIASYPVTLLLDKTTLNDLVSGTKYSGSLTATLIDTEG